MKKEILSSTAGCQRLTAWDFTSCVARAYKKSILIVCLSLTLISQLHAEIVNPVFSGQRYDYDEVTLLDHDNCGMPLYNYGYSGKTPSEVALEYLNEHAPRSTCTWTVQDTYTENIGPTNEFPGSSSQWNIVTSQPPYAATTNVDV